MHACTRMENEQKIKLASGKHEDFDCSDVDYVQDNIKLGGNGKGKRRNKMRGNMAGN